MSDLYEGFAFTVTSPSASAMGGQRHRRLLVVARTPFEASAIAHGFIPSARYAESGPKVLARARQLGIEDGGARIDT